eukprot:m.15626 g.15626  ORF g.15626 m.15626 type:complete len:127 (+) comp10661_c1_seq1:75-455(+)
MDLDRWTVLYLSHVILEFALGCLKLRGRYQHETPGSRSPRSAMYVRHHGWSLLSLALLGALVLWRDLIDTETGLIVSLACTVFHGGAVVAFLQAWADGAIPFAKVIVPHTPYAIGFAYHVMHKLTR